MGTYKRKIVLLASIYLCAIGCVAQTTYTLTQVDSMREVRQKNINLRLKKDIQDFKNDEANASILLKPMYLKYLRAYSSEIRNKLFICYKDDGKCNATHYNRMVLGLLDLPQFMKDSLLRYRRTETEVRAALGDTVALNKIIEGYHQFLSVDITTDKMLFEYLYQKKIPITLLLYVGTNESIKVFLEGMQTTDVYEDTATPPGRPKNKISIFYNLLSDYSNYIGGPPFLDSFYYDQFLYTEENSNDEKYQQYLHLIEQYFHDTHGVRLAIKAPYLIAGQDYLIEH